MKKYMAVLYELVNGKESTRWIFGAKEFDSSSEAAQYFLDRGWQYSNFGNYHLMLIRGDNTTYANVIPVVNKVCMEVNYERSSYQS